MRSAEHIEIRTTEYRPCYVVESTDTAEYPNGFNVVQRKEKKALFHRYAEKSVAIIKALNKLSTHPHKVMELVKREYERGILTPGFDVEHRYATVAIVEFEDGTVAEVEPSAVRFVPGLMNEYDFMEAVNENCDSVHKGER